MNRIERRIRNIVNPYSTAFAGWWCHSARYLPLVRMISGARGVSRRQMLMMNQAQMLFCSTRPRKWQLGGRPSTR